MISFSMVMQFIGGLGLFLYGVNTVSEGLQKIAANKLKNILESLTRVTWSATLFGIVMTVALQSSAATTVLAVEFVNSGLITLTQALGVALGSTIGTSVVIQLISFPIIDIALLSLFVGFFIFLIVRTAVSRFIGQTLIGFGCIFVGMSYLSGAFAPLKNSPEVYAFLAQFGANPVLGILISIVLTALIQSSAAYLAILISLSAQGLIGIEAVVPLVLGAHIGGTVTTLISSLGAERIDAKRVAVANTIYRVVAAVLILPFLSYFESLLLWSTEDLPRQVANAHLFSAILMVIIFLPLNQVLAQVLKKLVPQRKNTKELMSNYITRGALEVPAVALSQVKQEIRWLGHSILDNMFQILPRVINSEEIKWVQELEKAEKEVDWHYNQIQDFLKELFHRNMTRQQIVENHNMRLVAKELESIADCLVVMARLGNKIQKGKILTDESKRSLIWGLYRVVSNNYLALLLFLDHEDQSIAIKINEAHNDIIDEYNIFQGNMAGRENLSDEQRDMLEMGNWFYKIGEHITSIVRIMIWI